MSWSRLQGAGSFSNSAISSQAFTTQNCTVGALEVYTVAYLVPSGSPSGDVTLSDGQNTISKAYSAWMNITGTVYVYIGIFYAINTSATKLSLSISNYFSGAVYGWLVSLNEFSGNASSSPVDGSAYGSIVQSPGSGSQTVNGPQITTNVNGDLIYAILFDTYTTSKASALSAGSGFSAGNILECSTYTNYSGDEYEAQTSAGAITPTFTPTLSGTGDYLCLAAVAFKPSAGGLNMMQEELWWARTAYTA